MSFFAARVAMGAIPRRGLGFGDAFPVVETTNEDTTSGTLLTVTKPSGAIDGNLLVACFNRDWDEVSSPAFDQVTGGWTELFTHSYGTGFQANADAMMWRIIQAGDTTWDFTITGGDTAEAFVYRISGHDPVNPVGGFSFNADLDANTIVFPGILTDRTNGLLIHHPAASDGLSGSGFSPNDSGVVEDHDAAHGGATTGTQHATGQENFAAGGGTGSRSWATGFSSLEKRGGGMCWVRPILGTPDHLEFEGSTDDLLLEDGSFLILE